MALTLPGSRLAVTNVTAKTLIAWAYNYQKPGVVLSNEMIIGGPQWINAERFDIDADATEALKKALPSDRWVDEVRLMLQSLLADRFKLKVIHQSKVEPVFALVIAKGGPKLEVFDASDTDSAPASTQQSASGSPKGPQIGLEPHHLTGTGISVGELATVLSKQPDLQGRQVVDETDLKGKYDFDLQWSPSVASPNGPDAAPPSEPSGPSLFTALAEQLGLRLESTKAPVDTIVIEHIEEPTPN